MDEFMFDPDFLLSEIEENVATELAAEAEQVSSADAGLADESLGSDADLPLEPDEFLDPSQGVVTEATAWAFEADIPLPDPFSAALAGGGAMGALARRRARKAAAKRSSDQ